MDAFQQLIAKAKEEAESLAREKKEIEVLKEVWKVEQEEEKARIRAELAQERAEFAAEKEELAKRVAYFEDERSFVSDTNLSSARKIKLDVGGVHYSTTITTLTSQPESMLAAMFSGRHAIQKGNELLLISLPLLPALLLPVHNLLQTVTASSLSIAMALRSGTSWNGFVLTKCPLFLLTRNVF